MDKTVLWVTPTYPDFEGSYRGTFIKELAENITRRSNYKIIVLTGKIYKGSKTIEKNNNLIVYRFPFLSEGKLLINYDKIPFFRMVSYYTMFMLYALKLFFQYRINLIHAHFVVPLGLPSALLGYFFNKRVIITSHGSDVLVLPKQSRIAKVFGKLALILCDHVTTVAEHIKKEISRWGIGEENISVIPMSVDTEQFSPSEEVDDDEKQEEIVIFSNRNLEPIYDLKLLIKAADKLQGSIDFKVLIAGTGSRKKELRKEVNRRNLKDRVNFLGRIPHRRMSEYLNKSDLYVSTSLSDGTSVSLLEALATGIYPLLREIESNKIWNQKGIECSLFNDADELADCILDIKENFNKLTRSKYVNPSLVAEEASKQVVTDKYLNIYRTNEV